MVDAIYTRLSGDTGAGGVSTLVSGHIWESEAKQGETYPNLVFRIVSDPSEFYFGGAEDLIAEMQIDIYGRRRSGSAALRPVAERVRTILHNLSITATGFSGASIQCIDRGVPMIEDDAYRIMQRYRIFGSLA